MFEMDTLEGPTELDGRSTRLAPVMLEEDRPTATGGEGEHQRWRDEMAGLMAEFLASRK